MLKFSFSIQQSSIKNAGSGLFTSENISKGKIIAFPNQKHTILTKEELSHYPEESIEQRSSICWFEDVYTVDPSWTEESFLNHSFSPNAHWHLGFIFALKDISSGEEITIDYSFLLDKETTLEFLDSETGREIKGKSFKERMSESIDILGRLFSSLGIKDSALNQIFIEKNLDQKSKSISNL